MWISRSELIPLGRGAHRGMMLLGVCLFAGVMALGGAATAPAGPATRGAATQRVAVVVPTMANVAYGAHERQVLDFWKAPGEGPRPLVFHMHGGGWEAGSKQGTRVARYLAAGISVVSINYRYTWQAQEMGVKPPVAGPMKDAARALQFVRSKAGEWNIDKARIAGSGSSAGACTSLWLAFHAEMAEPGSADPVARESTRLWCAAVDSPQTSLDPKEMKEWTPNSRYGAHAFGFAEASAKHARSQEEMFADFLEHREEVLPWIKEYSPIEHVSGDDPAIYMIFPAAPAVGETQKDPTHSANFGVKLAERLKEAKVPCELVYPGAPDVTHASVEAYLIERLKQ